MTATSTATTTTEAWAQTRPAVLRARRDHPVWRGPVGHRVEVNCNQAVSFIGGYVSLYRDGTHLGSVDIYQYNSPYVYKLNTSTAVPPTSASVATTPIPITCT
jgi:hypothetical protein